MQNLDIPLRFDAGHPAFAGHFPGKPMVPGVLLLDAALHAAAPAHGLQHCRISSAKFLSPVLPGETLTLSCHPTAGGLTRFEITGEGRQVATGTFAFESPA